ncbi:anaerobic ribonucleoside-triphosphate reductase activating protein [Limibacterium fermenti]|uniref:anaerobic ribonucleoside-triphosphate reductase activating protein n=1 Tax=Limibacterium fermenti TaxID=3229863 RepID=UPI000E8D4C6F|nr:anaerobic ribonucleoside-triphosphate reductase activating protein [Porphyromonadaceae bacterium]
MNKISVLDIVRWTTVDGPGFRTSVYSAGCSFRCPGCHNPQSWDIRRGRKMDVDELMDLLCEDETNVTFSGGDPLFQAEGFTELAKRLKQETKKNIWCYTGYRFEEILASAKLSALLPYIDVLVDGRFVQALRDESLLFRGSANQRLIDVPASLRQGKAVNYATGQALMGLYRAG